MPIAIAVGYPDEYVRQARDAAARGGAVLKSVQLTAAISMIERWRPVVVVVNETTYTLHGARLEDLAERVGAGLALLPDHHADEGLIEREVRDAVAEGRRRRQRALHLDDDADCTSSGVRAVAAVLGRLERRSA